MSNDLEIAADIIKTRAGDTPLATAIVLSAGLYDAVADIENAVLIPYADLPGFPASNFFGQDNRLLIGELEGVRVACLKGRSHFFETGGAAGMALPLEVMSLLGATTLIVTSTCGSVDADTFPGTLAVVTDHINLSGVSPFEGENCDGGAISLTKAYDERLILRLKRASLKAGVTLHDGVFMLLPGPTFETPAEARMARTLGADMVGSTGVHEVILARRLGLRTCSIGAITHFGAGFHNSDPSFAETRAVARQVAISLRRLIRAFLATKDGGLAGEATLKTGLLRKQART